LVLTVFALRWKKYRKNTRTYRLVSGQGLALIAAAMRLGG